MLRRLARTIRGLPLPNECWLIAEVCPGIVARNGIGADDNWADGVAVVKRITEPAGTGGVPDDDISRIGAIDGIIVTRRVVVLDAVLAGARIDAGAEHLNPHLLPAVIVANQAV